MTEVAVPTLFTDLHAEEWKQFEDFAKDTDVSAKLNKVSIYINNVCIVIYIYAT